MASRNSASASRQGYWVIVAVVGTDRASSIVYCRGAQPTRGSGGLVFGVAMSCARAGASSGAAAPKRSCEDAPDAMQRPLDALYCVLRAASERPNTHACVSELASHLSAQIRMGMRGCNKGQGSTSTASVRVLEGAIYATVFCSERHRLVCCRTTRALAYAVGLGSSTGRAARLGHSLIAFSAPFLEV